ncbi:MAG: prepilin-type N-terminal cleavage/methylation domain-containing protein, partial [Desulfatitalea sp.]
MITQKRRHHKPELDNAGFTLLEIIAVIVILSILAVVAVPRYFDLQAQARNKAMQTAMAEGMGRINGFFAQQLLSGSTPGQINYDNPALAGNMGDF